MYSLTDLNFQSDDESSRYSDKPLAVDWKVYDVLLYDFRILPWWNLTAAIAAFGQTRQPVRRTVTICGSATIGAGTPGTIDSIPGRRLTRPCIGPSRGIAATTGSNGPTP